MSAVASSSTSCLLHTNPCPFSFPPSHPQLCTIAARQTTASAQMGMYWRKRVYLWALVMAILASLLGVLGRGGGTGSLAGDSAALLAFKAGVVDDPQRALAGWGAPGSPHCNWTGVNCDGGRVVKLVLTDKSLAGTISPALSRLSFLKEIDLSHNRFHGSMPVELGRLAGVTHLSLASNALKGPIPAEIGTLARLVYLNLGSNQLSGDIPAVLLCNCSSLDYADLSDNYLSGRIPLGTQCKPPKLRFLNLWTNELRGSIPPALSNFSSLVWVNVQANYLTGELPSGIFDNMANLQSLFLSYNNFTSHDGNTNLEPFFSSLSNCPSLKELDLSGNGIGGVIPPAIGNLTVNLDKLHLEENHISGPIPPDISNLLNLTYLNLSHNALDGSIPLEFGHLQKLQRVDLSNNVLIGNIPFALGDVRDLGLLDLSENLLTGSIPESLSNLSQLGTLSLRKNHLSGSIPRSLGDRVNLLLLDLSHNSLTGRIPSEVASLSSMLCLSLSHNSLQGALPQELGKMKMVTSLDLSSNNLSGTIPPPIGSCIALEYLNLSGNRLAGLLPSCIGSLPNLEALDLSSNELTGTMPDSLRSSSSLKKLNVSFNNFSGSLPDEGVFALMPANSFMGNPRLCGSVQGMPACMTKRSRKFSILLVILTLIATPCILCLVGCPLVRRTRMNTLLPVIRRAVWVEHGQHQEKVRDYPWISHRQLVEATCGFETGNLIGSGKFGRVYRGYLHDEMKVAVKVFDPKGGGEMASNFRRECQVLRRTRHRNLIRIVTVCSTPDFKALVLPLMLNGSLESHLYPCHGSGHVHLTLIQMVSICSDVAEGMAYLHHYSPIRVIHCDLKPSNVLLDEDYRALVSDFGISRLVRGVDEDWNEVADTSSCNSLVGLLCGSIGYIAPEYGVGGQPTTQGDVYSFGVLLLEVVTGKRPTDVLFQGGQTLRDWVNGHYSHNLAPIVQVALSKNPSPPYGALSIARELWAKAVVELVELGLLCTKLSPSLRPTMAEVAQRISKLKQDLIRQCSASTPRSPLDVLNYHG